MKQKMKNAGKLKASPQKFLAEVIDVHLLQIEAYICSEKGKLQNNMKQQNYSEGRKEKKPKTESFGYKNRKQKFRYA